MQGALSQPESLSHKVRHELIAVALTTAYFAVWLGTLMLLKTLVLAEYQIRFRHFSMALIGALILAKVVLVMERIPMGSWLTRQPLAIDVIARSMVYGVGVFVVLLIEKAFDARHEYGGFVSSARNVLQHRDMPHVWANALCILCALLVFNALSVVRRHLGEHELTRLFLSRPSSQLHSSGEGKSI